jgi:hypothetical protein
MISGGPLKEKNLLVSIGGKHHSFQRTHVEKNSESVGLQVFTFSYFLQSLPQD